MRIVLVQFCVADSTSDERILGAIDNDTVDATDIRVLFEPTVLITGDPIGGLTLTGPYEDGDTATEANEALTAEDWWVTALELPIPEWSPAFGGLIQ